MESADRIETEGVEPSQELTRKSLDRGEVCMKKLFFGMVLASTFGTTQAAFVPEEFKLDQARQLLNVCTVSTSNPNYLEAYGFCVGYFTGAMHYHRALAKGPDHKAIVCPEHTVTRAEAISAFVAWAKDNPQYLTEEPLEAVMRAAVAKWPCKPGEVSKGVQN
jgi:Rap1a immunity proteins